jgi:hypothetical protein
VTEAVALPVVLWHDAVLDELAADVWVLTRGWLVVALEVCNALALVELA